MLRHFFLFCALALPFHSHAWFDLGHEVVAEIAWRNLDAKSKDKVSELLKQLSPLYKEASSLTTLAKLPDHFRSGFKIFDAWHYVTLPIMATTDTPPPLTSPNAIWALCECSRSLGFTKEKNASDIFGWSPNLFEKAFMLPLLAHIVGDIHQPLHAVSRFTRFLPQGDLGGNLFTVRVGKKISNLHAFWDSGVGYFNDVNDTPVLNATKLDKTDEFANAIMKEFPKSHFGQKAENMNFGQWAEDSAELAKTVAYNLEEGSEPTKAYVEKGQKLVKERIALAGYRLAFLLTALLSEKGASQIATGCKF